MRNPATSAAALGAPFTGQVTVALTAPVESTSTPPTLTVEPATSAAADTSSTARVADTLVTSTVAEAPTPLADRPAPLEAVSAVDGAETSGVASCSDTATSVPGSATAAASETSAACAS